MVRFDFGPLLPVQMSEVKCAYNSLIVGPMGLNFRCLISNIFLTFMQATGTGELVQLFPRNVR